MQAAEAPARTGRYLTNDELEAEWSVSHEALRKFREDRADPIPYMKAGRRFLYVRTEIEAWAKRQAGRARKGRK